MKSVKATPGIISDAMELLLFCGIHNSVALTLAK